MKKNLCLNRPIPFGSDPALDAFAPQIAARRERVRQLWLKLTGNRIPLQEFATGHEFFGLHRMEVEPFAQDMTFNTVFALMFFKR